MQLKLWRLLPSAGATAALQQDPEIADRRIFQLDATFQTGGVWAGVDRLIELAYLALLDLGADAILDEHQIELYMVLLRHRDLIRPIYLSLTDTAAADERTRFYAPDRAYRLVHGLVSMVLRWKRVFYQETRWIVMVQNFDDAHHLGTLFFAELARRATNQDTIEVIVEMRDEPFGLASQRPGMTAVPVAPWIAGLPRETAAPCEMSDIEATTLVAQVADGIDLVLEQKYLSLFNFHRSRGDDLSAATMALKLMIIYKGYGYYHECRPFIDAILPYFEQLVGDDEVKRMSYVAKIHVCLVAIGNPDLALRVVQEFAVPFVTKPDLLADMNYVLGMHHLRYAEAKDIQLAERYILRSVDNVHLAKDGLMDLRYPFVKVFVDNGLAFLRARQGRYQEALDLCHSGYEFITRKLGRHRHVLHRSVLLYNIAQVYVMMGRLDKGLEQYRKAILMDPNYSEYHNEVGNILQEQGRYQEAIDHYKLAIRCSAPYPEVYFNKAISHAHLKEFEAALGCFDISLELNPNQPASYALRADLLRELGRSDEALDAYDTAIASGYDSTAVWVNRAVLHYNRGSYELALADMNHVIALEPQSAAHYENRASVYKAMLQQELYRRDIRSAERCGVPA